MAERLEELTGRALALIWKPALLLTESAEEFDNLHAMLVQEIDPHGIIERMHVDETAKIVWEMLRIHRCKAAMINTAFRAALKNLLVQLWNEPGEPTPYEDSQDLALAWFTDPKAKEEVAEILGRFHLDETAIEAEAIKSLAAELEVLDRMLTTLEVRRNRAIRGVAEYRETFAKRVKEGSDRIIEAETFLRLTDDQVST
ncbi:hypothetical protein [Bradyrhizobium sp. JYMT SZCCT0428]|uniref:hypothetical protein n=1 Tax=Bradyrhizobium sp. JYMT SZCCT0428 TaxID=2807673 RepID=UPI001BA5828A|nr:hypothetical protein [Bradyrhizobium sp. JYMT SZCCT0428]MBR1154582.1 hypothetical protein [Bradyrhizobium sp. JYMT SZCCT0428]